MCVLTKIKLLRLLTIFGILFFLPIIFFTVDYLARILLFPDNPRLAVILGLISLSISAVSVGLSVFLVYNINKQLKISIKDIYKDNDYLLGFDSFIVAEILIPIFIVLTKYSKIANRVISDKTSEYGSIEIT